MLSVKSRILRPRRFHSDRLVNAVRKVRLSLRPDSEAALTKDGAVHRRRIRLIAAAGIFFQGGAATVDTGTINGDNTVGSAHAQIFRYSHRPAGRKHVIPPAIKTRSRYREIACCYCARFSHFH